ncbi:amidohydrolase/deacetylase family metallohydrolase [Virgibacillus sp. MSJ-26]|uniref:amidohydrolase/deacetylase family metallohydrolase n=1 Tax=Virgibacillus sp. MSJ-26 TaxID=2841522 RepID=UPI001C100EA4|nr:amidohydrolase/deacetylase family metallohydrolase [Virgibacillus sp. MSJ-26]MBU5465739.1 amidohydrolase/deacetylase family metallohydrolase [Virgibacillus sp. MSJ-26]
MRQIIKNAMFINGTKYNIIIEGDKILEITDRNPVVENIISVPDGVYVSPGWIDLHTHSFPKYEPYCSHPDDIGYKTGVTTVVDAGSSGANDIDEFHNMAKKSITRVLSFINISSVGLKVRNELADLSLISLRAIEKAFAKYPNMIVGLKARMSASVIGMNGTTPLKLGKQISRKLNKPLMVHIGSAPPKLIDILPYLERGDIITHCFNEKENNHIFSDQLNVNQKLFEAIERGVYLDIGHGTSSFSYHIAKKAKTENISFHSISTDIYEKNQFNGPVYDMATTLSKFLGLGYSLEKVIHSVTTCPAEIINKKAIGRLEAGALADLTFFTIDKEDTILEDSVGRELNIEKRIKPYAVMIGGKFYECR